MSERIRANLSFANVMSIIAVFVAIGGGAYAAGLAKNSVKSKQIKDGQVKTADIRDGGVTATDLGSNAVTRDKLADGAVGGSEIAAGSVGPTDVANGAIAGAKIAPGAVNSPAVADNSLTGADIAPDSLGGGEIDEGDLSGVESSGVLASGETLRGVYATRCCSDSSGVALTVDAISFALTLPTEPSRHYIQTGSPGPAECNGTAALPQAAPGHLCIYETKSTNAGSERSTFDPSSSQRINGDTSRFGFGVYATVTSETRATVEGSWAVTAP